MNTRFLICLLAVVVIVAASSSTADARRRGPSPAQIKAAQEKQKAAAEQVQAYEAAKVKKDKEVLAKYDLNKNGKIDSTEQASWDKYWREVHLGKTPHPYTEIKIDSASNKTSTTKSTK